MTTGHLHPLLDLDPDMGELIPQAHRAAARRELIVEIHKLPAGPWDAGWITHDRAEHVGILLLDGVTARQLVVSDAVKTELLGPGDVVRPWKSGEGPPGLRLEIR